MVSWFPASQTSFSDINPNMANGSSACPKNEAVDIKFYADLGAATPGTYKSPISLYGLTGSGKMDPQTQIQFFDGVRGWQIAGQNVEVQ
jgi:hypothetical protein